MTSPKETDKTDATGGDRQTGSTVQSVDRALQILELIGRAGSSIPSSIAMPTIIEVSVLEQEWTTCRSVSVTPLR